MESIEKLGERLEAMEHRARMMERRLRSWRILTCGLVVIGLVILPLVGGTAQEQSSYERALVRRLAALEYKLQYISGGPNEVVITGANLRIVNGLGMTETTNGLGNLIVGYNEPRKFPPPAFNDVRTGSHNVVVGTGHNFGSFGGLVVGSDNQISGEFASVSGGTGNFASGDHSSVSGGFDNSARGDFSSVSGGDGNQAFGLNSSVSGGASNIAGRSFSSVSGGQGNIADGDSSSVSGGAGNTASGGGSSVSGGFRNRASGDESSVSGGLNRTAPDTFNWAAGPLFAAQ